MMRRAVWALIFSIGSVAGLVSIEDPGVSAVLKSEFIFENAPFAQCHAATIAETHGGLIAAWFGGTSEGQPDIEIWISRREGKRWTAPAKAANGKRADGTRLPCWNPVLYQDGKGPLLLFYKVGPSPSRWWGMMMTSGDGGRTWTEARRLPAGILGPVKNHPVRLQDGTILCGSSTEDAGWRVHFERTADFGVTWKKTPPINDGLEVGLIQPALLRTGPSSVVALMRSTKGRIYLSMSEDGGLTWTAPAPTGLPNPNSGIDAVTLRDGRHVLVYNPVENGRSRLSVAVSSDAMHWTPVLSLEDEPGEEFSYPAVIQAGGGTVHIVYTWKRRKIKHVVLDPSAFKTPSSG